jgi:hypothetical protein
MEAKSTRESERFAGLEVDKPSVVESIIMDEEIGRGVK